MSDTPIADMIEQMDAAGASVPVILAAVRVFEGRYVTRNVTSRDAQRTVTPKSNTNGAIRARRHRAKLKQNKALAEANDAAIRAATEALRESVTVTQSVTPPCDLSSSSSFLSSQEETEKKKRKKEVIARARATRIPEDWQPRDEDREFAQSLGLDPVKLRDEFVDYWIAIPGSRGTKLNWFSTYRNRARDVAGKRSAYGQRSGQTRTYSAGPAPSNTDTLLAGMARSAERRFGSQSPGSGGALSGRSDTAGGDDAVGQPPSRDSESFGQLRVVAFANTR